MACRPQRQRSEDAVKDAREDAFPCFFISPSSSSSPAVFDAQLFEETAGGRGVLDIALMNDAQHVRGHAIPTAAALVLVLSCLPAAAQQVAIPDAVTWICGLKPQQSDVIECQESSATGSLEFAVGLDPLPPNFSADLFAAGARRNITRLVRAAPQQYAGRVWRIPLISPLIDAEHARELALSVMCGGESGCNLELRIP